MTTGLSADDGSGIEYPLKGQAGPEAGPRRPRWAGALTTRLLRLPSPGAVWSGLKAEAAAQLDHAVLWTPVAFGAGAALYLGLKVEPPLWPLALAAGLCVALAAAARILTRNRALSMVSALIAVATVGLMAAKLRTDLVAQPVVPAHLGAVVIEGWVTDVANPTAKGARLVIAPVRISRIAPEQTPYRIRIVTPAGEAPGPGASIRVTSLLDPPPGPAAPGAYDFARDAWFSGLGGVGLALKPPTIVTLPQPPMRLRVAMAINAARWSLARRIAFDMQRVLGGASPATGLAVTVATSHEDWLADGDRDDLRAAGLAHMLAIAGLHMAAVSGFAFFAIRLAIAAWPWLALRVPGKKMAAVGALTVVIAYLVLSGAHPPARRAAITAAVAFIAILLDRRVLSLHSLSIAALLILLMQPEAVTEPGFEMSFCATAALIALAEAWPRSPTSIGLPWPLALLQRVRDGLIALVMVSFVAGSATGPFAIQHFNRVANYGVPANLIADLIASVVMMPALALGVVAEALHLPSVLTDPPLWVAGQGARAITGLAHLFAHVRGSGLDFPSAPTIALATAYVGIVFACLWRGKLRWIGVPMAAAVALWPRPAPPVAWIAADGNDAAVVIKGQEVALKPNQRAYATQLWAQRRGFALPTDAAKAEGAAFTCDRKSCAPKPGVRPALAAWWSTRAPPDGKLDSLCQGADILVLRAAVTPPAACAKAVVLGPDAFIRGGAAEIYPQGRGWRVLWSEPLRGRRPWTAPALSADEELVGNRSREDER